MPEEITQTQPFDQHSNGQYGKLGGRPKNPVPPADFASFRVWLMAEIAKPKPDKRVLRLGERLLKGFDADRRHETVSAARDARIAELEAEMETIRSQTLDRGVARSIQQQSEKLSDENSRLRTENTGLQNQNRLLTAELTGVKAKLEHVQQTLAAESGELWASIRQKLDAASSEEDFKELDDIQSVATICGDMAQELNGSQPNLDRRTVTVG